jgi:hypothetical protein
MSLDLTNVLKRVNNLENNFKFIFGILNDLYRDIHKDSIILPDVLASIMDVKLRRSPFSLIRIGDGEGTVLGYPELSSESDVKEILDIHFGPNLNPASVNLIKKELVKSINTADIIGIPSRGRSLKTGRLTRVQRGIFSTYFFISSLKKRSFLLTDASIHVQLSDDEFMSQILNGEKNIGLITCHPQIKPFLLQKFKINNIDLYQIPGEHRFSGVINNSEHFPDVFNEIGLKLKVEYPGQIFLVAAGLLAKPYCSFIKIKGGIALDIGSVADLWASIPSRPYIKAKLQR